MIVVNQTLAKFIIRLSAEKHCIYSSPKALDTSNKVLRQAYRKQKLLSQVIHGRKIYRTSQKTLPYERRDTHLEIPSQADEDQGFFDHIFLINGVKTVTNASPYPVGEQKNCSWYRTEREPGVRSERHRYHWPSSCVAATAVGVGIQHIRSQRSVLLLLPLD